MATELTKYQLVPNNNNHNHIVTEFRGHFSLFKTKKSTVFVYGVVFIFIAFTVFLAFSPSSSASTSSWFINIFTVNSTSPPIQSLRSPISTDFSSNLSQIPVINSSRSQNIDSVQLPTSVNLNNTQVSHDKVGNFEFNATKSVSPQKPTSQIGTNLPQISPVSSNQDQNFEFNDTNFVNTQEPNSQTSTDLPQVSPVSSNQDQNFEFNDANNDTTLPQISPVSSNQVVNFQPNDTQSVPVLPQITDDVAKLKPNNTVNPEKQGDLSGVILPKLPPKDSQLQENSTLGTVSSSGQEGKVVKEKDGASNFAASLSKKPGSDGGNDTVSGEVKKEGKNMVSSLVNCDLYDGDWVRDDSYPLYKPGSCELIDEQFNCKLNGRPDDDYQKLKWKPKGCTLPRLNGRKMLKLLRGKRLVFVGDSLNRNMWESLVCILKNSVKNPKNVYEAYGRHYFRNEVSYSFVFKDYNCTVEFFVAPFLVRPWEVKDKNGTTKETLRLDLVVEESEHFKNADILIYNTGHWWTHEKTSKGEDYYQEGSNVYKQLDVTEAFRKAMTSWGRWVDANINPKRTHVFFRGYSNTHFSGGQWNSGGQCDSETEPIRNETYLTPYPWKMEVFEKVMKGMKVPISYLNITRMTDYRKDAHPSVYRKQHLSAEERKSPLRFQDCSHWCLPGVPDLWNELLYAEMLRKKYQDHQQV